MIRDRQRQGDEPKQSIITTSLGTLPTSRSLKPQGCCERDPHHDGDDYPCTEHHPRDPNACSHDGLAQRYDDHEAVAFGEVACVDPEARNTTNATP